MRAFLAFALLSFCGVGSTRADATRTEHLTVEGLEHSVEILTDRWGIPHIYAKTQSDLFFAQGFNAARDRLFQFEIWRRQSLGLMAQIQGERSLKHDIGARLLQFRGDLSQELAHYHSDGEQIINSFVGGVNAYIATTRKDPELLPIEFKLLGIEPGFWTPSVVVSRHNAIVAGADQEVRIAQLVHGMGADKTKQLLTMAGEVSLQPKPGIELADLRPDVLELYRLARRLPAFMAQDIVGHGEAALRQAERINTTLASRLPSSEDLSLEGSNAWVIAGERTATRSPLLASDPHRRLTVPSLRYWVHLVAPGWNVIGGGEPVLPGVSIGHNERGAWGLTIFSIDQEDVLVYETRPRNPNQYWYEDAWEDMKLVTEEVPVRDKPSKQVVLKFTRHGPVLFEDPGKHKAYALRAAWLQRGAAPYLASLRINQAANWHEFRAACAYAGMPAENMLWADKDGNIGWQAAGFAPLRIGWDGNLPVPGDGSYEWAGYVPIKSMPHSFNPKNGYLASANQYSVPVGYPNIFGAFWTEDFRYRRIGEVLDSKPKFTVRDAMELQHDELSLPARELVPLLARIQPSSALMHNVIEQLSGWDYVMRPDSVPAAIFTGWKREISDALVDSLVEPNLRSTVGELPNSQLVRWLNQPDRAPPGLLGPAPELGRNELLTRTVLKVAQGSHMPQDEDARSSLRLTHPLARVVPDAVQKRLNIGPLRRGGDGTTVNLNMATRDGSAVGAGFRIIVDTSDWDSTRGSNMPGQSGDPRSAHYEDMSVLWEKAEYFPVYYTRKKVESVLEKTTILRPAHSHRRGR